MIPPAELAMQVASLFPIEPVENTEPTGNGHVHETWLVTTREQRYILQKLNSHIGVRETENMLLVTKHLRENGMLAPRLILNQ